jgi:hypothetical protein
MMFQELQGGSLLMRSNNISAAFVHDLGPKGEFFVQTLKESPVLTGLNLNGKIKL